MQKSHSFIAAIRTFPLLSVHNLHLVRVTMATSPLIVRFYRFSLERSQQADQLVASEEVVSSMVKNL